MGCGGKGCLKRPEIREISAFKETSGWVRGGGGVGVVGAAGAGGKCPLKRGDISEISAIKETYGWLG